MMKFFIKYQSVLSILLIVGLTLLGYWKLFYGYFEQDEWATFAMAIVYDDQSNLEKIRLLFAPPSLFTHFTPIIISFVIYAFLFLGANYEFFAGYVVVVHILNSLLLYRIVSCVSRVQLVGLAAALLFGVHNASSQAVIWIAGALGFQTATFFFLLSVVIYLHYLSTSRGIWLIFSAFLFVVSLLCTESTATLILVYPFVYLALKEKKVTLSGVWRRASHFKHLLIYPLGVLVLFLLKLALLQINPHKHAEGFVFGTASQYPKLLLIKIFLYPLQAFSQIADYSGKIFSLSSSYLASEYPPLASAPYSVKISETVVPDLLYLFFSLLFLALFGVVLFILWKKQMRRWVGILLICLFLFFVSILPYVPLPKAIGYLENRYYYTPNIFFSTLTACFVYAVSLAIFGKGVMQKVLMVFIVGYVFLLNYQQIQTQLDLRVTRANIRKSIISQIRGHLPRLTTSKNVFYVTGSSGDYFVPGLKVPFQSGFGNVLMVTYFDPEFLKPTILDDGFLYPISSQGFRQEGDSGFGYYYDKKALIKDYQSGKFDKTVIHAYYWDDASYQLRDITEKTLIELDSSP